MGWVLVLDHWSGERGICQDPGPYPMPKDAEYTKASILSRCRREILGPRSFFIWIVLDYKPNTSRPFVLATAALVHETQGTYGRYALI